MASTYSTNLKIELIGTGEQSGLWGSTTNTNLGTAIEEAITGRATANFTSDANLTLTLTDSNATQVARNLYLNVTSGVSLTATRDLIVPTINKQYIVRNATTGSRSIVVKTAAGTGVTVPNGAETMVFVDGTNVIPAIDYLPSVTLGAPLAGTSVSNTPAGNIAATTVQAAVNELDSEKVAKAGDTMTGPLAQAAGTAALPSYTFSGDTNTGIYSPGADIVAVATGGIEGLRVDASRTTTMSGAGAGGVDSRAVLASVGTGGTNRGVALTFAPAGSANSVEAVRLIGYQNAAAATATSASFGIQVADSGGTLQPVFNINNAGTAQVGGAGNGVKLVNIDRAFTGSHIYFATQADAVERINVGHYDSGTVAFPTGKVAAQILAAGQELNIASRDTAGGAIVFRSGSGVPEKVRLDSSGNFIVTGSGGLGYGTGSGGTVTQATSRTTGVTLNKPSGAITLFSTTTTAGTFASFTLTNSSIAATDGVEVCFVSGATANSYGLLVTAVAAGSCRIQIHNIAAVGVAEAPVIRFNVIKGASS